MLQAVVKRPKRVAGHTTTRRFLLSLARTRQIPPPTPPLAGAHHFPHIQKSFAHIQKSFAHIRLPFVASLFLTEQTKGYNRRETQTEQGRGPFQIQVCIFAPDTRQNS